MKLKLFFFFVAGLVLATVPASGFAYTRYKKCELMWGSADGAPVSVSEILATYSAKTKQAFMSRLPLDSMSLRLGQQRLTRCDDAFDDLEARLSRQYRIYLDAHSGYILLLSSRAEADRIDRFWEWQWQQGLVKSEGDLPMSCFTSGAGVVAGTKTSAGSVLNHPEYLAYIEKKFKRKISLPDALHEPEKIPLTVLMTKSVCKAAVWNGYVLGMNINNLKVISESADAYRVLGGK